jgi:hypothetical protein
VTAPDWPSFHELRTALADAASDLPLKRGQVLMI